MPRKVLVIAQDDTYLIANRVVTREQIYRTLQTMGYAPELAVVSERTANNRDLITEGGYEFAVVIHPQSFQGDAGWLSDLVAGTIAPCFVVNHSLDGAWSDATFGVNRNQTSDYRLCTFSGLGELPVYCTTHEDTDTAGREITPLAWETATPTNLVAWKMTSGTYAVYGSAEGGTSSNVGLWFPILLQHAINDGELAAPPKPAIGAMDLDDWPEDAGTVPWTPAQAEQLADDLRGAGMVTTIGMHASKTIGGRNELADVWEPAGVLEVVRRHQIRNGGPFYPIEHQGSTFWSTVTISGSPASPQTKADIDTFYRDHIDNMHNHGIWQGWNDDGLDSYGYHLFNTNRINDKALQLALPETSVLCDPAEATAIAGYNWQIVRVDANAVAAVVGARIEDGALSRTDYLNVGIIDSRSPFNSSTEDAALASNLDDYTAAVIRTYFTEGAGNRRVLYLHGQNGNDYNNPDVTPPLRLVIEKIGLLNAFCADTFRCVHPSAFAA